MSNFRSLNKIVDFNNKAKDYETIIHTSYKYRP